MAFSYRIFDSIEHVDAADWQRVVSQGNGSFAMDPRFIAAVEASIKQASKFWYIILYDAGAAVCCTTACAMTVDLADLADRRLVRLMRHIPWLFSRLRHLKVLICGLPVGTLNHTLGLAQRSTSPLILPVLDEIVHKLAVEAEAEAVIYKEFGKADLDWTAPLQELGYHLVATPPSHVFSVRFEDFARYCAALRKPYRKQIKRSRRKLSDAGLEIVVLSDPEQILRAYTPEVHALYHQMLDRASMRVEVIPIEFLRELTLRLNGLVELLAIRNEDRIVAFACCLHAQSAYYTMFGGLDYELNSQFDLYFNLMYGLLERGLDKRVSTIVFGLAADAFKARIGCHSEPLYVFVKGRGALLSFMLRAARSLLIARKSAATPPFNIFRNEAA